jgi:excisionase family DNA binding protein
MIQLLKVAEVAERLALARSTVYRMMSKGEIPSVKIGGSVRVSARALDEWIEERSGAIPRLDESTGGAR